MPAKVRRNGEDAHLLTVSGGIGADGKQILFRKTIKGYTDAEAAKQWTLFAADCMKGDALEAGKGRMTLSEFYQYWLHEL